jgi:rod shape-determining protein MreB
MRLPTISSFSEDIAIDLGTVNTIVHVMGRGVVIDEPSVVAVRTGPGHRHVLAVGHDGRRGRLRRSGRCAMA